MKLLIIATLLTFLAYGHGLKEKTQLHKSATITSHFKKPVVHQRALQAEQSPGSDENEVVDESEVVDETVDDNEITMEDAVEECGKIAEDMDAAGKLSGTAKTKTDLRTKFNEAKAKAKKMGPAKITKKVSRKTLSVASAAGSGLVSLVQGVQSGSWANCVSGALAIMASVAAFFGPVGMLVSIGLTVMSMLFGVLGGILGGEESTEDMLKRLLEKALTEARAEELKAEGAGLKKLYGSVTKSIGNFREQGSIEPAEAMKLYNFAFEGVRFFGVLDYYIKKDCKIGNAKSYEDKKDKLKEQSNRCLEQVNLYCDLSILRQIMMTDLASFLAEKGLNATYENILELIAKEQRADMKFLRFIYDPMNHPDSRYVSAKFFAAREKYSTLSKYLTKLDDIYRLKTNFGEIEAPELITPLKLNPEQTAPRLLKNMVMFCTDVAAMGSCIEQPEIGNFTYNQMNGWQDGAIKSIYLTANRKFTGYLGHYHKGTIIGPFYGPGIYSMTDEKYRINSYSIECTDEDATKMMRVCEKADMDMTGACFNYKVGDHHDLDPRVGTVSTVRYDTSSKKYTHCVFPFKYNYKSYDKCEGEAKGYAWCAYTLRSTGYYYNWDRCILSNEWDKKIKSFSLPEGMKVIAYKEKEYKTTPRVRDSFYYWHIGPTVKTLASPDTWRSMKVKKTNFVSTKMLQVCNAPSLGGYCAHLRLPENQNETKTYGETTLQHLADEDWTEDSKKIKSLKVPGGARVEIFAKPGTNQYRSYGPYEGPATLNTLDGQDTIIKKIVIKRLY